MDVEKLVKRMRRDAVAYRSGATLGRAYVDSEDVLDAAANAIETLLSELETARAERDAAVRILRKERRLHKQKRPAL